MHGRSASADGADAMEGEEGLGKKLLAMTIDVEDDDEVDLKGMWAWG